MKTIRLVAACLFATAVLAVTETPLDVKPGLWQIDQTVKYTGLPPNIQAMLDRLTPEQRTAMGYGAALSYKKCITEKGLNTSWVQGDNNCKWTVLKSTATELEVQGTNCKMANQVMGRSQGLTSEGLFKIHVLDSEHLQGSIHGTATGNGVNATMDGSYKGKWISATCPADTK